MTPARWQEIKDVVGDALEKADAAERAAFLARRCAADTSLRREVNSLLARSPERLEACATDLRSTRENEGDSAVGRRIGAYRIVRELGRGGMGAVFLAARADDEFEKEVAIKLLKRGTDTDEVLRRFRSERDILASLDHPHIARLLDAGTTPDGLPYFVMEYVSGARVTDYCFAQNLSIPQRLELFLKICGAVRFAHQNLIVHRDLKPANILVTTDGEPKLLDFGIAKLLAIDGAAFQLTLQDQQRLTPAYASPEQVRGETITTVSDVYTLGVLLYELLADRSPHQFTAAHPSPTELLRVVGEVAPIRPSLAAPDASRSRLLRGDLDNILLTALRKEPARRYPGVGAFAEDIQRHLQKRPVRARAATFGYRAGKLFSRNKAAAIAGALAIIALLAGTVVSVWNAQRARSETQRAARNFEDVRRLTNSFLFEFHDAIANLPGATSARRLVVSRALEYLDKLSRQAASDPRLQMELAEAYLKIGDVQGKPYTANLGDAEGAIHSYGQAARIATAEAGKEDRTTRTDARDILSKTYASLATVQVRANLLDQATANTSRALEIGEALLRDDPAQADDWRRLIISCDLGLGDAIQAGNHLRRDPVLYHAALAHYRRALPVAEQSVAAHPQSEIDLHHLARTCARIAGMLAELGAQTGDVSQFDESFAFHQRTAALYANLVEQNPENIQFRRNLADSFVMTAYARVLSNRELEFGINETTQALQIEAPLAAADPANAEAQQDLGFAHYMAGRVRQARGEFAAAAGHYRKCLGILESLVRRHPGNVETATDLERARKALLETETAQRAPGVR